MVLNVLKISKMILMSGVAMVFIGLIAGVFTAFYNLFFGAEVTGAASFAQLMQPGWPAKTSAAGVFVAVLGLFTYAGAQWLMGFQNDASEP